MAQFTVYPCPSCGSELNYDADRNALVCNHCGSKVEVENENQILCENDILNYFQAAKEVIQKEDILVEYKCSNCGKETSSAQDVAFFECTNCGNNVVNQNAYKSRTVEPTGIIPFSISQKEATQIFHDWIGNGWFYDSDLKKMSLLDKLKGHYLPFWTFDAETKSSWNGYSGRYVDQRSNDGKLKSRKTRWTYREGTYDYFFDDVLICGNLELLGKIEHVKSYNLKELKPFHFDYIVGWDATAFDSDMSNSYLQAKSYMESFIHQSCISQLREDTYRDFNVQIDFNHQSYKHIILPVWSCEYIFKGKNYYFVINGQTGMISGNKPLSYGKIIFAILAFIAAIVILSAILSVF